MLLRTTLLVSCLLCVTSTISAQLADPWRSQYQGDDATGKHVIALWQFLPGQELEDSSGNDHALTLRGATVVAEGKFGGGLQSGRGWPVEDVRHAAVAKHHPDLSPRGPFTLEMWIQPHAELEGYPEAFLIDKKYVSNDDYQLILGRADGRGTRQLHLVLGFGDDSESFWSQRRLNLEPDRWHHLAVTYDAAGTATFWVDGDNYGSDTHPGRGSIHPGNRELSIGDRLGSHYHGFPGLIDQVRISRGVREYRPVAVLPLSSRTTFLRMESAPSIQFEVKNLSENAFDDAALRFSLAGVPDQEFKVDSLPPGKSLTLAYKLDTRLRPDQYELRVSIEVPTGETTYQNTEVYRVVIAPRVSKQRMPVVMWGSPGRDGLAEMQRLGFTHCLGLTADDGRIWEAGAAVQAVNDERLARDRAFLDEALARGVRVMASLSPGRWLESQEELLRVDREGQHYERENIAASLPKLNAFAFNVGASAAKTWGEHPAWDGALIGTEIRDGTQLSFHPHDRQAFREFAGYEIPEAAVQKRGVPYAQVSEIGKDRVVPDDHPLYVFYRWFWKQGDGWNPFHSAVHQGLTGSGRDDLWTFYDPAVRVPSVWGSGGEIDVISHWTYSYPDPIRIGLAADELFAMAAGAEHDQDVMKMTQVIWYRSQTAPPEKPSQQAAASAESASQDPEQAPWEDFDPSAQYITISPMHLREAFWTKLARPIQGIMYHGWGSLVPSDGTSSYRYTHPETQNELARLVHEVVEPLGPTLKQIPAAPKDVAMLESFASQIFASRGTWGWGNRWTGDAWHVLQYAHLQPEIVYEETISRDGLDRFKILVMPSCDVLPASVVERVKEFQQRGGIVVGDERLAPAIRADITMKSYNRTKRADEDKQALLAMAAELRKAIDAKYARFSDTSNPEVISHDRRYGSTDYVFLVNDRREFGDYVGHHGMVMENGLPAEATLSIRRERGHVYDLLERREVATGRGEQGTMEIPVSLAPCGGGLFMVTDKAIEQVAVRTASTAKPGSSLKLQVAVANLEGQRIDAVVPVRVDIFDPAGRPAEFSGYYGAADGRLELTLDLAPNDRQGVWEVRVQELASGLSARTAFRVSE
ncbi:LamG-like jellyroll fold domain-containing protein [Candidatus Laterigemmans baculatus]|uniref:LamG-like jellyroll fold domain-containing protein n=1 Tax=Candidatus Laterigemmans baculatus TaxID=2770505 RepID=UPI0013DD3B50|nr:LamG-like jellyroll fold domain-containing protein [Candidatus Laterigemmans baculatus]